MAGKIIWYDSFDQYVNGSNMTSDYAGTPAGGIVAGRIDGQACSQQLKKALSVALNEIIVYFAIKPSGGSTQHLMRFYDISGNVQCYFEYDAAGNIYAYKGDNTLFGQTSTSPIVMNTWSNTIGLHVKLSNSGAGFMKVTQGGTSLLNLTGLSNQVNTNGIQQMEGVYNSLIDDFVIIDPNGTGNAGNTLTWTDFHLYTRGPGANDLAQFTPSTGSNWQTVDEQPFDDTDYNEAATSGLEDRFTMANQLPGTGTVYFVGTVARWLKTDAGTNTGRVTLKSSTTQVESADIAMNTTATFAHLDAQDVDPATSAAWVSVAAANAVKFGYKRTA